MAVEIWGVVVKNRFNNMIIRPIINNDEADLLLLLKQLTDGKIYLNAQSIIDDLNCNCLVLEEDNKIIGTATISFFVSPIKGLTGVIEDVVIDKDCRGRNLGKILIEELIKIAKHKKAKLITLTSSPKKENARKLYQSLGFELYDTGFFKLKI